jgi:hypothetical protein
VLKSSTSTAIQQSCPSNCNGHGRCAYFESVSGLEISTCSVLATTCNAACVCENGFSGTSCIANSALAQQQNLRSSLLNSLNVVVNNEDATADSVGNIISSIAGIVQNPSDVNNDGVTTFSTIASTTLTNSLSQTDIRSNVLSGLLGPIDVAMKAQTQSGNSSGALLMGNTILSAFSSIVERDAAVGLPATTYTYNNFKIAQQTIAPSTATGKYYVFVLPCCFLSYPPLSLLFVGSLSLSLFLSLSLRFCRCGGCFLITFSLFMLVFLPASIQFFL